MYGKIVDAAVSIENAALGSGQLQPGMQVLTKPFAVDTLASRVRELLAG